MAPTPPSADAAPTAASTPSHDERTRRNVACVNCRNSKVRCKTSQVPGHPCQRCSKLQISCVVDKSHKRVTKRSKLEQLEQELRTIQQVVNTKSTTSESAFTPPSPRAGTAFYATSEHPPLSVGLRSAPPQAPTPHPEPPAVVPGGPPPSRTPEKTPKTGPTEARVLGNHVISGEDIDYYFIKFLQHFHPFMPILRKKEPDECYEACPTLFWVILYVTCRRYARDDQLLTNLVDHLNKELWLMISTPALGLEEIHAILFVCAWPFPTIRFVTDPSSVLSTIAMNACMMLGFHIGHKFQDQFCIGSRSQMTTTAEEAASTWVASCMLAQRMSAGLGHPPPNIQHNDTSCKAALESSFWAELLTTYDLQKFLNRFHAAMSAQAAATGSIPDNIVTMWESELETIKPLIIQYDTEISRALLLAAQLEVQAFYFMNAPDAPPTPNLRLHTYKVFNTARAFIVVCVDLESRCKFITHAPNLIFRSILDAANILVYLLHSHWAPPDFAPHDANVLARQACGAFMRCSVREGDMPYRGGTALEAFWSFRNLTPKFDTVPPGQIHRGGAGVSFACLDMFKRGLLTAQRSTDGVNKALDILQSNRTEATRTEPNASAAAAATPATISQERSDDIVPSDPFQDVDWTMFMDDFGWVGENGVLLNLM